MNKSFYWGAVDIRLVSAATFFILLSLPGAASAYEFDNSGLRGSIDTTLSYGSSARVQSRDSKLICTANGGSAYGCNSDDGNLNYDTGKLTNVMKFTTDIEINHKTRDFGAFFRVRGFVDSINDTAGAAERTTLSAETRELIGSDFKFLDAYGWSRFDLGGRSAEVRVGRHVLNWGESTFIQGGINAINPIDVAAIRLPGAELREALLPVSMVSLSADMTDNLSVEGFYQIKWEKTLPDPSGSYFGVNDFAVDGGRKVQLGFGAISDSFGFARSATLSSAGARAFIDGNLGAGTSAALLLDEDFLAVPRAGDNKPKDEGQFGVAFRYFSEELNDTEFGFYYMNYHSRLPLISAKTGTAAGRTAALTAGGALAASPAIAGALAQNIYAKTARYLIEYPEDIQLLGLSFNTNAGLWALQGEYSFKKDAPLQIDDVELLLAALTPISALNAALRNNQITNGASLGTDQYIRGYIQRDVSQMQVTATKVFSNVMGADQFAFVAEAAVTYVHNMPSKSTLRLNAPGTFVSGNSAQAATGGAHAGKAAEDPDRFADATSWGYRLLGRWTFNNAYKAVNLQPRVAWQHDVNGITPGPGGNFIEGRKAVTLGMTATYKNDWAADVGYTSFYGAGNQNLLNDRDFIAFNVKYSF